MASLADAQRHLTTCSICFETFETPRYLSCKHCFCEGCLQTYIISIFERESSVLGISCPVCRYFITKPSSVNYKDWAGILPTERELVLDNFESESDGTTSVASNVCTACERENENRNATWWCVDCCEAFCVSCERQHRRFKSSASHEVVGVDEAKKLVQNTPHAPNREEYCQMHEDMKLEAYCFDHSAACCLSCALTYHRKCNKVDATKIAAKQLKVSNEVDDLIKSFETTRLKLTCLYNGRKRNRRDFRKATAELKTTVRKMTAEYKKLIDDIEEKSLKSIESCEEEVEPGLERQKEELQCQITETEKSLHFLRSNFFETASDVQFLTEIDVLQKKESEIREFVSRQQDNLKNAAIHFEFDKYLSNLKEILTLASFGEIRLEKINLFKECIEEIDVNDEVTGVEFLRDGTGRLLISKLNNKEIQLWDSSYSELLHSLPLAGKPWGIKMINLTEGGVILGDLGLVLFTVDDNRVVVSKKGEMSVPKCRDFAFDGTNFYIGGESKIQIYDSNLNYLQQIEVEGRVRYLDLNGNGSVYFTKLGDSTLYCTGLDGTAVFEYTNQVLQGANGICSNTEGHVCICASDRKSILHVDCGGTTHKVIFSNLPATPLSIALSTEADRLVLGCRGKVFVLALF